MAKRTKKTKPLEAPPIIVEGARTHNLKNVSCHIPSGKLTVVTGLSGSGKSSLAFDTLYAEGQRRYVESLSTYARQFIARMARPDADLIDNIPPAIALEQKNNVRNARSTIGTATEINDYLRPLFARAGRIICPTTGEQVTRDSPQTAAKRVVKDLDGARAYVVAPVIIRKKTMLAGTLKELVRQGYTRLLIDGEMIDIDAPDFKPPKLDELPVVIDRFAVSSKERGRITEALEAAFRVGQGRCYLETREGERRIFTEALQCPSCPGDCGSKFREPSPQLLSFSSPLGACPTCQGFGRVTGLDWGKIIPNPTLAIDEGAIVPFNGEASQECYDDLRRLARELDVRMDVPWKDLTKREQEIVREGSGKWYGIRGFFEYLEERRYKVQSRIMIARFRGYSECPDCRGQRLREEALAVRVGGKTIGDLCELSVRDLHDWFEKLKLTKTEEQIAERPLSEVRSRLAYLMEVGLEYLSLSRQTRTLSGGEAQRINLSTALGSALTETLYVLDEPTVGLHPRDTHRLIGVVKRLRDIGNSVVIVEHDPEVIREADHLIDIGPEAGEQGGQIIYQGDLAGLKSAKEASKTAGYVLPNGTAKSRRSKKPIDVLRRHGRRSPTGHIGIRGAHENNLDYLDVDVPLGVLCCITGVSGSGKSTLIKNCLYHNWLRETKGDVNAEPGAVTDLVGLDQLEELVLVDQSPIGRSIRSNPATYLKAYDAIRNLLTQTPEAKARGLKTRDFSFNVPGGRCETCEGTGFQTIDMHFLADVTVPCEKCEGRRFQDHILHVRWKNLNVDQILALTISEAIGVFEGHPGVLRGLYPLQRVGLGYLRLGQSTSTLSGGEAQRLKLASHIADAGSRGSRMLLLFDEPTTGLHPADLDMLMGVFEQLLEEGFSLVIIEHNLQLIRSADYIIDLGPEGGDRGGKIIAQGTPEDIASSRESITGKYLRAEIERT